MANVKPFSAYRPRTDIVADVAALPYDVYNREEAKAVVLNHPLSFLRIDRAETQFDDSVSTYDPMVYAKAKELLDSMINKGEYVREKKEVYYIYSLTMDGREQVGIVACASVDDYQNNVIKKHENTRAEKEQDRINHVYTCKAQTGPIFLAYRATEAIDSIVNRIKEGKAVYDFVSEDGIRHAVWVIDDDNDIAMMQENFASLSSLYIADGHHRAASAVRVGEKLRSKGDYTGDEEFNYFLSVLFPHNQLKILPYNRVVRDFNGYSKEELFEMISKDFWIIPVKEAYQPTKKGTFGMYVDGAWFELTAKDNILSKDPVEGLDVSILQNNLLNPILGIKDPRTDSRIDFVGGIRGLEELERRVHSDMKIAFSMYPTSIDELFEVADANLLMPPKSTWFEPKLRSGIFVHEI